MATKKEKSSHSAETLALYDALISALPGVKRKGATMPYTSLNGNMFSFINKDGSLCMRLPEKEIEAFIKKYKTDRPFEYGIVMKEYVLVPENLLKKTAALQPYFISSYTYAKSLKTKPSKKK